MPQDAPPNGSAHGRAPEGVVQAALKLVLEPIFEADFEPVSYGFRPGRRAQDAIAEIHFFGTRGYRWVLDADIEAAFDNVSHSFVMDRVRVRVKDKRVLALVKAFLKAGVLTELGENRDTLTGTPQGGILSPLIFNIAMTALDEQVMHRGRTAGRWLPSTGARPGAGADCRTGGLSVMRRTSPNLRSSIYQDERGKWHGRVTMGVRDDGHYDRRHVRGATRTEVARKVRVLERERDSGTARAVGQRWTVTAWLEYWLSNIAVPPHVAENTHLGYKVDVSKHLVPGIGAHRLEKLTPEHVERLYAKLGRGALGPGGVHHVHRTVRAALNEAVRRSHLTRNPVLLAKAPKLAEKEVEPYGVTDVQRLLDVASARRNSAVFMMPGIRPRPSC